MILDTSIPSSFDVSFSSEGCVTSVLCSYPMKEGDCFFQYGYDSSYQDLSSSLSTSLNSPLQITISDAATIHYYQVTINTSSLNLQVRGNFTSGEGELVHFLKCTIYHIGVCRCTVDICKSRSAGCGSVTIKCGYYTWSDHYCDGIEI